MRPWGDGGKQETHSLEGEMDPEQEMTDGRVCRSQGLMDT